MMNEQDFDTIDWEAEAARIVWAFGVTVPAQFVPDGIDGRLFPDKFMWLHTVNDNPSPHLPMNAVLSINMSYHSQRQFPLGLKYFNVFRSGTMIEGHSNYSAQIDLNWDGSVATPFLQRQLERQKIFGDSGNPWYYTRFANPLAKGLYHLGLLSPDVEAALDVSISEHQKMEWTLEYEARNDL